MMRPRHEVDTASSRNTEEQNSVRKRTPKACRRCNAQKIKCNGSRPCHQCSKRGEVCQFKDVRHRSSMSRGYSPQLESRSTITHYDEGASGPITQVEGQGPGPEAQHIGQPDHQQTNIPHVTNRVLLSLQPPTASQSRASSETPLTNPLLGNPVSYIFDPNGKPVFMGTSSNWAFGKRVLSMTHEQIKGTPLLPDGLHFPDLAYDLVWDGTRIKAPQLGFDITSLPSPDFALHLIGAVKFRCGQLFYLFDEDKFMEKFHYYHENPNSERQSGSLWYVHYLLILAFGKAFVVQNSRSQQPGGTDLFVQAMKLLPDLTFYDADPVEKIQVICCAALYLQCLDYRVAAYRIIGDALSIAMISGMHLGMQNLGFSQEMSQKCSRVWWTVFVLERWITSLIGLPIRIPDEVISAPLPAYPSNSQLLPITDTMVKLSRILAQILNTVYGAEGKLDKQFLRTTKAVLKRIADITDQLNSQFGILRTDAATGISRIAAHLHLLHHQCVIITTRPLLYSFLSSRLGRSPQASLRLMRSNGIRALLQMCIDSAQKMLNILTTLLNHGILEGFLPFDLEATFTASISLLMVTAIDPSLLPDHTPWSQRAYNVFDEIAFCGNKVAKGIKLELQQLESMLSHLPSILPDHGHSSAVDNDNVDPQTRTDHQPVPRNATQQSDTMLAPPDGHTAGEDLSWLEDFTAAQLMDIADAVDIDSLDWIATSGLDFLE